MFVYIFTKPEQKRGHKFLSCWKKARGEKVNTDGKTTTTAICCRRHHRHCLWLLFGVPFSLKSPCFSYVTTTNDLTTLSLCEWQTKTTQNGTRELWPSVGVCDYCEVRSVSNLLSSISWHNTTDIDKCSIHSHHLKHHSITLNFDNLSPLHPFSNVNRSLSDTSPVDLYKKWLKNVSV